MPLNYHALGQFVRQQGGEVLCSARPSVSLNVAAFVFGHPDRAPETFQAFSEHIERFGPDDFFLLKKVVERISDGLSLPEILSCLRLSGWDADVFLDCFPILLEHASAASDMGREELRWAIRKVWNTYYPIGEQRDLAFCLGMLLYTMAFYVEALELFQHSLRLHGPDVSTAFNMALCHYELRQLEPALDWIDQTLQLDPAHEAARGLRLRIEVELDRQRL